MVSDQSPWSLAIPSDLRLISLARHFVETFCQHTGLDRQSTDSVVLATHEAINNVIRHAYRGQQNASLQIQCHAFEECLEIHVIDEGEPFDVMSVPHLNPGEIRIGGRGVYLMRTLMDEITCLSHGSRGNTLRMVKRCRKHSSSHSTAG